MEERPSRRPQADIIRLLLTDCRKSEILTLRWSEVDGDMLRLAEAKTGPCTVWLSDAASAVMHPPAANDERLRLSLAKGRGKAAVPQSRSRCLAGLG